MTLYTYPNNFRAYKALIAAQYSGAKVKVASETEFVFGETNKSQEFLRKFPLGKVPAYETADGQFLTESNAIAFYLANAELRGKTELQQAEVWQWVNFADSEILPASCAWVFPLLGIMPFQKKTVQRAKQDAAAALAVLNTKLTNVTFLVGDRISLADICVFCTLLHLFENVLDANERAHYVSLTRWFNTILNQPQVKAVIPNFQLCAKQLEFDPEKYAQFVAKTGGAGEEKEEGSKKKQDKPKQEKKKEQPKKEEKQEPAEELDPAEAALLEEPKSKDPFDSLPKGTFNMDDFKRFYSNEDEAKSVPYFWEKFDPENYSIWYGEYKYNEELTKVFMSCNLITGMFQRLDKMRKQAFASVCLWGEDNNSTISGVWVWRGKDLAFELSPDWQIDYDCYAWKKLDPSANETKELVKQYFSWTGERDGRKFNQGKVFK
ncbi:elongation factor 1-gamma [Lutzomyia longipalpis]|uniref:elongation factor 1-gamma n=1 Tax=Lutzomyia longipalpis TaxID=7200 RepID=UPI0024841345|nr:elongation factor 1-gamma [Lutzomyia longipalpis]